jgi:hypothetical protein
MITTNRTRWNVGLPLIVAAVTGTVMGVPMYFEPMILPIVAILYFIEH